MEQNIELDNTYMNVIKFGTGSKNLAIISGISLCGLEGTGDQITAALSIFSTDFTVYVFDRKKLLPEGYSMEQMAEDIFLCLNKLGINKTSIYGVSQGGMIGMLLSIRHPEIIEKLVLCSTATRKPNNDKVFAEWRQAAINHDVVKLNTLFLDYVYSDAFKENIKEYIPSLLKNGTAKDCDRFKILLDSIDNFDITERIAKIHCPILVIHDKNDKIFSFTEGQRIAELTGGKQLIYNQYSHAVYDEAPDLKQKIVDFCK